MPNWMPWRIIVKHLARWQGFIDPITVYARLQNFAQPSEVGEPIELLRAGVVMHARGLINSRAIQHNLDWVWPYWVEKQFNPEDASFVPRAFSITHINLTHRNWSGIGQPGLDEIPIVDPRGLVTPFWDSWSLDTWFVPKDGQDFLPSRSAHCEQSLDTDTNVTVATHFSSAQLQLSSNAYVSNTDNGAELNFDVSLNTDEPGWLVISVRPYNPEGISFIDSIQLADDRCGWIINGKEKVLFNRAPDRHHSGNYKNGDVYIHLKDLQDDTGSKCNVGMATAAAMFETVQGVKNSVNVTVPLNSKCSQAVSVSESETQTDQSWPLALEGKAVVSLPNRRMVDIYEAAVRTLVLCSPSEVYAGPFTYKRFWYRDAVYIIHGLLSAGLISRAEEVIKTLPDGQKRNGYFHSQDGEWDSNGQVLWIYQRYCQMSNDGNRLYDWETIEKAANWIINKRLPESSKEQWPGLMPAGFSAEHLGPNDYYYWDDYWSVAGLESAAWLARYYNKPAKQQEYTKQAQSLRAAIDSSLVVNEIVRKTNAVPAAPGRRMDAGAIGSVVASYPLQQYPPQDEKLLGTVDFLLNHCFVNNGFFQDMIHSGINAYLSLHVAQALLRAGDERYLPIINSIADLASPTGHWPEAIHPSTGGGCMGDGHHAWAAAEWIAIIRSLFIREEGSGIVLCSGIMPEWLTTGETCSFGPTPTLFGTVSVRVETLSKPEQTDGNGQAAPTNTDKLKVTCDANWHDAPPVITIDIPGYKKVKSHDNSQHDAILVKKTQNV